MAAQAPTSYKDPYWTELAGAVEAKLNLPQGLLAGIVTRGERSNADQVSEAGARTPFQIIPATRQAAIDKFGIDPYLSPENAAEVSGLLLKDSLKRNQGDAALAVAEFHGGTDRANWGPKTKAYVQRVVGVLPASMQSQSAGNDAMANVDSDASQASARGQSTFDRVLATMNKPSDSAIANVLQAYQSGQMSAEDARQFEADVQAGRVMLPRGASLGQPAAPSNSTHAGAPEQGQGGKGVSLPESVVQAYASGRMSVQDRIDLEHDVRAGLVKFPEGVELHDTKAPGFLERLKETFTGSQRRTQETDTLPDWAAMPELNSFSLASAKTGLGTLLSDPHETVKIIRANFPGVELRQDEHGNYLLRSSMDGQEYAIKPGFQPSDIPRAAGAMAAFTPAGRATTVVGSGLKAAGTQAAIEASQALTGGDFDPGQVAAAGATGLAVPMLGNVLRLGVGKVQQTLDRARGVPAAPPALRPLQEAADARPVSTPETTLSGEGTVPAAAAPGTGSPTPAQVNPAALSPEQLGQATRKAATGGFGSTSATRVVAQEAAPDAQIVEAARRLGIEDYLQPDHVTTNQAFRELSQVLKSVPGSASGAAERQGLERVAQRADDLISEIGGTHDMSMLDAGVKRSLDATRAELKAKADKLYDQVRAAVPMRSEAPADNVVKLIEQRAADLGGRQYLSGMEKQILLKLEPRAVKDGSGAVIGQRNPTYALLDDVRRDLTAAKYSRTGAFKDADDRLVDLMQGSLRADQQAAAAKFGMGETWDLAQKTAGAYKAVQDDLTALFGRNLDGSIVGDISKGISNLSKGDTSRFVQLMKSVPDSMRQEVVASGLATAFGKNARAGTVNFGSYARWYEGLQQNQQAFSALMTNLPKSARQGLQDLYRVSDGISKATRERITTGRLSEGMRAIEKQLEPADTLMGRVYELATKATGGMAAEAITTPMGLPGAGVAAGIASALRTGPKATVVEAADKMFASPEFIRLARASGTDQVAAAKAFSSTRAFSKFMLAVNGPVSPEARERWVLQVLRSGQMQASDAQGFVPGHRAGGN